MTDPSTEFDTDPTPSSLTARRGAIYLAVAAGLYAVVVISLSFLRWTELFTGTWDLGIYQQALWATGHAHPLYESADLETGGFASLLQIHSSFVLFAVAPIYNAAPTALTLFVLQGVVVAAGAFPLYAYAIERTGSVRVALAAALVFLAWAPVLSGNLYDFHVEAFLPLEFFTILWLWQRGWYVVAAPVLLLGFLTLEVAPVLTFFIGLYFLIPAPGAWDRYRVRRAAGAKRRARRWRDEFVAWLRSRRTIASLALLVASLVAFGLIVVARQQWIEAYFGIPPYPSNPLGYVGGYDPSGLGLGLAYVAYGFAPRFFYWLALFALLGMIPLLAPRELLLAVPWVAFTFFSFSLNFVEIGYQYGFLAACALFPAFIAGLPYAVRLVQRRIDTTFGAALPAIPSGAATAVRSRRLRWVDATFVVATFLVAVNLLAGPINPALHQAPGFGEGYVLVYAPPNGFDDVRQVAGLVPNGALVVATSDLFPLVANSLSAYTLGSYTGYSPRLPFSQIDPPPYVLLSENRTFEVPAWLSDLLYNSTVYGLRGIAWASTAGPVLLFETRYAGAPLELGAAPVVPQNYSATALRPTVVGHLVVTGDADFPYGVGNFPGSSGLFMYGPSTLLPAGNFTVTVWVHAAPVPGALPTNASEKVLVLVPHAFGLVRPNMYLYNLTSLTRAAWTPVHFPLDLPGPTLQFLLAGSAVLAGIAITVGALVIAPTPTNSTAPPP